MERIAKEYLGVFWGSFFTGGTVSVYLLWTGPVGNTLIFILKYLGIGGAAATAGFCGIMGKYAANKVVAWWKERKNKKTTI